MSHLALALALAAPAAVAGPVLTVEVVDAEGELVPFVGVYHPEAQVAHYPGLFPLSLHEDYAADGTPVTLEKGQEITLWVEAPNYWPRMVTHTVTSRKDLLRVVLEPDPDLAYRPEGWRLTMEKGWYTQDRVYYDPPEKAPLWTEDAG